MKAEVAYEVIKVLSITEREKLFKILKEPFPEVKGNEWIYQRKGLSEYLGGIPEQTLIKWEKAGIIKSYKIARQRMYKKSEIDKTPIPMQ